MSSFLPNSPPTRAESDEARQGGRPAWAPRIRRRARSAAMVLALCLAPTSATAAIARHATHVEVRPLDEPRAAEVVVSFTAEPGYTARLEKGNRRLVIDVTDADVLGAAPALTERVGVVGGVLTQAFHTGAGSTTRILVTLMEDAKYLVSVRDHDLVIRVRPGVPGVDATPAVKTLTAHESATPRLTGVDFEHHGDHDEVVVSLSVAPKYIETRSESGRPQLVFQDTRIGEDLEQKRDVSAYGGLVTAVSSFGDPSKHTVTIEAESDGELATRVGRRGSSLLWTLFKPGSMPASVTGVAVDGGAARMARTLHVEDSIHDIPPVTTDYRSGKPRPVVESQISGETAAGFTPAIAAQADAAAAAGGKYDGRRIDLDLKDADIHNVLRLLADVGRVNIVTADDVQGNVTIRMRNIPWDQALDVVLQSKNLGMVQRGNIIRVAPLAQLEKEREMAIARRRQELQIGSV